MYLKDCQSILYGKSRYLCGFLRPWYLEMFATNFMRANETTPKSNLLPLCNIFCEVHTYLQITIINVLS